MEAIKPKAKKKSSRQKPKQQSTSTSTQEVELVEASKPGPSLSSTEQPVALPEYDETAQEQDEPPSNKLEHSIAPEAIENLPSQQAEENKDNVTTPKSEEKTDAQLSADFAPTAPPPCSAQIAGMLYPDLSQLKLDANINQTTVPEVAKADVNQQSCISVPRTRTLYLQCIQQMEDTSLQSDREHLNALEQQFVACENPHAVAKDPGGCDGGLYLYIQTYRTAYHSYREIVKEQTVVLQQISSLRSRCWNFQQVKFSGSGLCDDGRMVNVSLKSRVAMLNIERSKEAKSTMSTLLERYVTKAKEGVVQLHHSRAMVEKNVCESLNPDQDRTVLLRIKLRIVGNALRTEMHETGCDQGERCDYVQDLRHWFRRLGTLLLEAGNVDDRVWLMMHVLRFPHGIGLWAHWLVHPLLHTSSHSNHMLPENELQAVLTIIHVLLRPIREREKFLAPVEDTAGQAQTHREAGTSAAKAGDAFEWVDSDGEDSSTDNRIRPIKEDDLLALLEQLPFQRLYETIIERAMHRVLNGEVKQLPTTEMLRLITFANKLVAILGTGLSTYCGVARFNHFVQRLALLINDTVKFVSDVLRLYRDSHGPQASEEVELVQVHFDTLIYNAARCIYGGGVSLSRHLSTLPFSLLSSRACWWVFRSLLNRDFNQSPDFEPDGDQPTDCCTLVEQFVELPHVLYNKLKPFVELALARNESRDRELIANITKTLFELLASISADKLVCAEIVIDQIHMILEQNATVLSVLLQTLAANDTQKSQTTANAWQTKDSQLLEVFSGNKKLLMRWNPTESDIAVMREMLLNYPRTHVYHKLALGLLMYINYGDNNGIYVRLKFQVEIAYCVVAAFRKNQPAGKVDPESMEWTELKNYQERCLFVLLQLRLHVFDQPTPIACILLYNPAEVNLEHISSLELFGSVKAAVDEQCPVASLIALLNTTTGHWVPVFCQEGVNLLKLLLEQHHLDTIVVRCLELITVLFIECPQALSSNKQFITLLALLVAGDNELDWSRQTTDEQQLSSFARKLLGQANMGKMGSMFVSQVNAFWRCRYKTPPLLVCMWCEWLTQIPGWKNCEKVLRLLNVLASVSFGHRAAWNALREKMRPFFKSQAMQNQHEGKQSLWAKIMGTGPQLLYGALPSDCVALALLVYGIEHQQLELDTELWTKLLRTLKHNKTIKLDAALRQVHENLRSREEDSCPSADSLVFFKIARFLVRANVEHPLYLAVCQQFFTIYLTRVTDVGEEVHGVSDRLYSCDTALMEKIKQKLCSLELHYHNMQETNSDAQLRLVKAFQLWLVDMDLNRFAMDDPIYLPVQYDKGHLQVAFTGVKECWPECLNRQGISMIHRIMTERWHNLYRHIPNPSTAVDKPPVAKLVLSPMEAIQRRLENCYTTWSPLLVAEFDDESQDLIHALQLPPMVRVKRITESLQIVKQFIDKNYWSMKAQLDQRQHELFELYRQLYVNEDKQIYKQAKCRIVYCAGAASVKIHTKCAAIDKSVQDRIAGRLNGLPASLQMIINIPLYIMKHTIMLRELWNSLFVDYCTETDQVTVQTLNDAIRTMLRTLLHEVSDTNFVPPLTFAVQLSMDTYRSDLSNLMLEEVGQLFAGALEDGRKPSNVIVAMLENSRIPVRPLLQVYGQLVKQKHGSLERNLFVDLFGNKLNLSGWLKEHDITPEEVDQFAKLIVIGLYKSRPADSVSPASSGEQAAKDIEFSDMLISHLVILAGSKFPENFGKMVQHTLNAYSQWPTLPPAMLLALLNLLRSRAQLDDLYLGMEESALRFAHRQFAESNCTQPVLSMEVLEFLMVTVTEHFVRQRDSAYPWSGMYRRHGAYVEVFGMLLGMFSHSFLAYGMGENQIRHVRDHLLPVVYRMFVPWVVPYGAAAATTLPGGFSPTSPAPAASANESARHFNNDKAKWMFAVLLHTIEYTIDKVLVAYADTDDCSQILLYFLNWYLEWFVDPHIMISALYVFNTLVLDLTWERLQPSEMLIERMHALLEHHSPECHEFLAAVFVRCNWTGSNSVPVPAWLQRTHASTLAICVRLAYEPVIRSEAELRTAMVRLLQYFTHLSWETLHVAELTPALDWFVMTAEADSMLRTPKAPCRELDDALLEFLEIVAGMRFNEANRLVAGGMQLLKRKLYTSVVVRMLMNAGRASGKGANVKPQLAEAVQQLLRSIGAVLEGLPLAPDTGTDCPRAIEARAMTMELLMSIKKWQTENSLSLFVDELIHMLESDVNSQLLTRYVLESASVLDSPAVPWLRLLERAVGHYLCPKPNDHEAVAASTWLQALNTVGYTAIDRWQLELLLQNCLPLCLNLYFLHHWEKARCDPVAHLRLVNQLLATLSELKISEPAEYQLYPLWCTLMYSLLTVQPEPDAAIRTAIGLFGTVSENSSFWVVGMLKKMLGKETQPTVRISATRCLIGYAFAVLLAHVYARRAPQQTADGSETDDYSETTGSKAAEPFTLSKLLSAPDKRASRERILSAAVEHFKSASGASANKEYHSRVVAMIETISREDEPHRVCQHAKDIIVLLESRAKPFLNTLLEAIVSQ